MATIKIKAPNLVPYQSEILDSSARFTITIASTKIGKTFSHIWWIFKRAHEPWNRQGYNHWWVAPVHSQAEIAFNRIRRSIAGVPGYSINLSKMSIGCPTGAIIVFKTGKDPNNLYGEDVYSCVFDEAPRSKYSSFVALRSTLTATGAPMKLIGNYGGRANWMSVLMKKAQDDPQYAVFKITAWDAVREGILDRAEIEQAQKDLSPQEFKMLYLAEDIESDAMLISYDDIDNVFTNDFVIGGSKYITADVALMGSDKFVAFTWEGLKVTHIDVIGKCEAPEVEGKLKDIATKHKVPRSNIIYDADGVGAFLSGYLKGATAFHGGAAAIKPTQKTNINYKNLKSQCGYKLSEKIRRNEINVSCVLEIEQESDIKQELECLQAFHPDDEGKLQILPKKEVKEMIGRSPDYLDNFLMRMMPIVKPKLKAPKVTVYE